MSQLTNEKFNKLKKEYINIAQSGPNRFQIEDELCIPFVDFFNDIGMKTIMSCQGHNDDNLYGFWIEFSEDIDEGVVDKFFNCLGGNPYDFFIKNYSRSFYGRFELCKLTSTEKPKWRYTVSVTPHHLMNQNLAIRDYIGLSDLKEKGFFSEMSEV